MARQYIFGGIAISPFFTGRTTVYWCVLCSVLGDPRNGELPLGLPLNRQTKRAPTKNADPYVVILYIDIFTYKYILIHTVSRGDHQQRGFSMPVRFCCEQRARLLGQRNRVVHRVVLDLPAVRLTLGSALREKPRGWHLQHSLKHIPA